MHVKDTGCDPTCCGVIRLRRPEGVGVVSYSQRGELRNQTINATDRSSSWISTLPGDAAEARPRTLNEVSSEVPARKRRRAGMLNQLLGAANRLDDFRMEPKSDHTVARNR